MQKGIKFRIYPNREQKNFIHQTLGCCRFIYNRGLAMLFVCAIAGKLLHIGFQKFLEDRRMRSLAVIVYKK